LITPEATNSNVLLFKLQQARNNGFDVGVYLPAKDRSQAFNYARGFFEGVKFISKPKSSSKKYQIITLKNKKYCVDHTKNQSLVPLNLLEAVVEDLTATINNLIKRIEILEKGSL
jgi:hypothetical protein